MNYKTTLVVAAIAAAFVALGSAFPILESAYASTNTVNQCTGTLSAGSLADCRQQGFQQNQGDENEQTNNFGDE
jgi:hypothetical protein